MFKHISLSFFLTLTTAHIQGQGLDIDPEPDMVAVGSTATFTATALTTKETEDGWTYKWFVNGTEESDTGQTTASKTMDTGGSIPVKVVLVDGDGNDTQWSKTIYFTVVDVSLTVPSELYLSGQFVATGVPSGGDYSWNKDSGPGDITFTPSDEATTDAEFSEGGSYGLSVTYTVNDEDTDPASSITAAGLTFGQSTVYVPVGEYVDVTITSYPGTLTWNNIDGFRCLDGTGTSTAASGSKPAGLTDKIRVTGASETGASGVILNIKKGDFLIGRLTVVVFTLTIDATAPGHTSQSTTRVLPEVTVWDKEIAVSTNTQVTFTATLSPSISGFKWELMTTYPNPSLQEHATSLSTSYTPTAAESGATDYGLIASVGHYKKGIDLRVKDGSQVQIELGSSAPNIQFNGTDIQNTDKPRTALNTYTTGLKNLFGEPDMQSAVNAYASPAQQATIAGLGAETLTNQAGSLIILTPPQNTSVELPVQGNPTPPAAFLDNVGLARLEQAHAQMNLIADTVVFDAPAPVNPGWTLSDENEDLKVKIVDLADDDVGLDVTVDILNTIKNRINHPLTTISRVLEVRINNQLANTANDGTNSELTYSVPASGNIVGVIAMTGNYGDASIAASFANAAGDVTADVKTITITGKFEETARAEEIERYNAQESAITKFVDDWQRDLAYATAGGNIIDTLATSVQNGLAIPLAGIFFGIGANWLEATENLISSGASLLGERVIAVKTKMQTSNSAAKSANLAAAEQLPESGVDGSTEVVNTTN